MSEERQVVVRSRRVGVVQCLLATCRLQGVDPHTYLIAMLQGVGRHPAKRTIELTPRVRKTLFANRHRVDGLASAAPPTAACLREMQLPGLPGGHPDLDHHEFLVHRDTGLSGAGDSVHPVAPFELFEISQPNVAVLGS